MQFRESETVELKQIVTDDIKKEVIAFANTNGGAIYIGIADDGGIVGISDPEETILQINNMLRDAIKPDIMLFVQCRTEVLNRKNVISVDVQRGTERPYYLAAKGLRPEGVYVRQGTASVPATGTAIRRMISETDGNNYESLRSLHQDLTFKAAKDEFKRRNIEFGISQMMTLGLLNADKIFTNLGLLLSDQCVHTIKVAVFQDETQSVFKDRREFGGSLFKQLNDVYEYIDLRNQIHATFDKLLRVDIRDYPAEALREVLLNAVVHREYALGGSILIKIFGNRIEFISVGGLVYGIELADIMSGYSICRNPLLAAVFYRLQLIEAYGTGMQKIFEAYEGCERKPEIKVTPNVFKVILPNINADSAEKAVNKIASVPGQDGRILQLAEEKREIRRKDVESLLSVSQTLAGKLLRKMTEKGVLSKRGGGRTTKYLLV